MKFAGYRPLFFLLLLIAGFMPPAGLSSFHGVIIANPKIASRSVPPTLTVVLNGNGRMLAKTTAGSGGSFTISFPPGKDSVYDFSCTTGGPDTLFLKSVTGTGTESAPLTMLYPCEPDTTASGDIICPKCRKEDQVYPVVYGDPIIITRHFDTAGKISYEQTPKTPAPVDSPMHAARYYCRRDKITF